MAPQSEGKVTRGGRYRAVAARDVRELRASLERSYTMAEERGGKGPRDADNEITFF